MRATSSGSRRLESALRADGELKLVPYVMAGHPDRWRSVELGRAYARAGAAAVEVGLPHSDPLADGPAVRRAGQAALDGGVTTGIALEIAAEIGVAGAPVVLMTYANPVLAYGVDRFAADAAAAGVAGVIVPDLPLEESEPVMDPLRAAGLDMVFLVAPTSPDSRIAGIAERSSGFVYCVTVTGVTGARSELPPGLEGLLARVRAATPLPVAAGFGISRAEHARRLRGHADAMVVASALLERVDRGEPPLALLEELLAACR